VCLDFLPWHVAKAGLTFAQLANVQTVGLGLYLALAVIQAISATGVAGLSRRVATLRSGVASARLGSVEAANVRRLSGDVSGLEIGFHVFNRRLLGVVFCLFLLALIYFAYCTICQGSDAGEDGLSFIIFFYLALPMLIFVVSSAVVAKRCSTVAKRVSETEKRIRAALLSL
jgi:hypothetical protein